MLRAEGVRVIDEAEALRQDIRPLQIALLNLMPEKPKTETQLARLLGADAAAGRADAAARPATYRGTNTPLVAPPGVLPHLGATSASRSFDGLIVTGAPVELLPFEQVDYWSELTAILDWTQTHVHSTFSICWGAQAALYHFHSVPKHILPGQALRRLSAPRHRAARRRAARR